MPKLLSLVFFDQCRLPSLSFERASSQCRISIHYQDVWDDLKRSLVELNDQDVYLTLPSIGCKICTKGLKSTSGVDHLPTAEVESLILSRYEELPKYYSAYFDAIF